MIKWTQKWSSIVISLKITPWREGVNAVSSYSPLRRISIQQKMSCDRLFTLSLFWNVCTDLFLSNHCNSKESEREKSIARYFPLNGNPPLLYKSGRCIRILKQDGCRNTALTPFTPMQEKCVVSARTVASRFTELEWWRHCFVHPGPTLSHVPHSGASTG